MERFILSLALIIGLTRVCAAQTFDNAESMVGHSVFFKGLANNTQIFEYVFPLEDGKVKEIKLKDQYKYSALADPTSIFEAENIASDKKGKYLIMSLNSETYYFMFQNLKENNLSYDFYQYAEDYDYYQKKYKELAENYHYIDALKLGNDIHEEISEPEDLYMKRFSPIEWKGIQLTKYSNIDFQFKIGERQFILKESYEKYLLPKEKKQEFDEYNEIVMTQYAPKYKYYDLSKINGGEIDSSKIICKYFYPFAITGTSVSDSLTNLIDVQIDDNQYRTTEEQLNNIGLTEQEMSDIRNTYSSLLSQKDEYKYIDNICMTNNEIAYNKDSLIYAKYYPMSVIDVDLTEDNSFVYIIEVDGKQYRVSAEGFNLNAKTSQGMDEYKVYYDEWMEEQRIAQAKAEAEAKRLEEIEAKKDAFFIKNLKGYEFSKSGNMMDFAVGESNDVKLSLSLLDASTRHSITLVEKYIFIDRQTVVHKSYSTVDARKFSLKEMDAYGQALSIAKDKTTEELSYTVSGNEITINDKTFIFNPTNKTLTKGKLVYSRKVAK